METLLSPPLAPPRRVSIRFTPRRATISRAARLAAAGRTSPAGGRPGYLREVVADHLPAPSRPHRPYLMGRRRSPDWDDPGYLVAGPSGVGGDRRRRSGRRGRGLFIGEEDRSAAGSARRSCAPSCRTSCSRAGTLACVAGVETENTRSLRAFEKAARPVRDYEEKTPHSLMRLERDADPDPFAGIQAEEDFRAIVCGGVETAGFRPAAPPLGKPDHQNRRRKDGNANRRSR